MVESMFSEASAYLMQVTGISPTSGSMCVVQRKEQAIKNDDNQSSFPFFFSFYTFIPKCLLPRKNQVFFCSSWACWPLVNCPVLVSFNDALQPWRFHLFMQSWFLMELVRRMQYHSQQVPRHAVCRVLR